MSGYANILTISGPFNTFQVEGILAANGSAFVPFAGNTCFLSTPDATSTKNIINELLAIGVVFTFVHIQINTGSFAAGNSGNLDAIRDIINDQYHYLI